MQRSQQAGLFVIVVIALRPKHLRKRRILTIPGAGVLLGLERALLGVRAAVAKRFVKAADAVVHRGDKHQVAGRPSVEIAVRKDAGHAELRHRRDVVPADDLPLIGENRVDPGVIRLVADRVVVEIRHRLVQVVQNLRFPADIGIQNVFGELERDAHGVAVVVVRDIFAPIDKPGKKLFPVREVPFVEVDHAVAAVHFDDRSNQRDGAVANFPDVRTFIDGQAVGQLHERRGSSRFRRMDCPGYVINGDGLGHELVGFRVIELDGAGIGELGEAGAVFLEMFQIFFRRNGDGDHLAALFRLANREDFYPRSGFFEQTHVFVHIFRVRKDSRRARDVAKHDLRSRHRFRGRQIIHQR